MRAKVFVWPSSEQKVRVRVASLNKKFDEKPPVKINCPVCGNLIGRNESCCDASDSIQFDDDDIRALAPEVDYD